jgi:hypothetical protein
MNDPHTYRLQVCIIIRKMNSIRYNIAPILFIICNLQKAKLILFLCIYVFVFICTVQVHISLMTLAHLLNKNRIYKKTPPPAPPPSSQHPAPVFAKSN